jgi:hypothetical protein
LGKYPPVNGKRSSETWKKIAVALPNRRVRAITTKSTEVAADREESLATLSDWTPWTDEENKQLKIAMEKYPPVKGRRY